MSLISRAIAVIISLIIGSATGSLIVGVICAVILMALAPALGPLLAFIASKEAGDVAKAGVRALPRTLLAVIVGAVAFIPWLLIYLDAIEPMIYPERRSLNEDLDIAQKGLALMMMTSLGFATIGGYLAALVAGRARFLQGVLLVPALTCFLFATGGLSSEEIFYTWMAFISVGCVLGAMTQWRTSGKTPGFDQHAYGTLAIIVRSILSVAAGMVMLVPLMYLYNEIAPTLYISVDHRGWVEHKANYDNQLGWAIFAASSLTVVTLASYIAAVVARRAPIFHGMLIGPAIFFLFLVAVIALDAPRLRNEAALGWLGIVAVGCILA